MYKFCNGWWGTVGVDATNCGRATSATNYISEGVFNQQCLGVCVNQQCSGVCIQATFRTGTVKMHMTVYGRWVRGSRAMTEV